MRSRITSSLSITSGEKFNSSKLQPESTTKQSQPPKPTSSRPSSEETHSEPSFSPSVALTTSEVRRLIAEDPDFVHLKRFDYSIRKLLERYPDGCPTRIIAQALMITEEDVEAQYQSIVVKLRESMGVPE